VAAATIQRRDQGGDVGAFVLEGVRIAGIGTVTVQAANVSLSMTGHGPLPIEARGCLLVARQAFLGGIILSCRSAEPGQPESNEK
jgi:hypothetical protein